MLGFVIAGSALLAAALLLRELQWSRDRARFSSELKALSDALDKNRRSTRKLQEDLFVLQTVLRERNLLAESELVGARKRLIDRPKRVAAERDAIQQNLNIGVPAQVIEESINKVH
ncbi:MAG: hypothetical protein AAFU77_12350 [Myxococcota bacterium]